MLRTSSAPRTMNGVPFATLFFFFFFHLLHPFRLWHSFRFWHFRLHFLHFRLHFLHFLHTWPSHACFLMVYNLFHGNAQHLGGFFSLFFLFQTSQHGFHVFSGIRIDRPCPSNRRLLRRCAINVWQTKVVVGRRTTATTAAVTAAVMHKIRQLLLSSRSVPHFVFHIVECPFNIAQKIRLVVVHTKPVPVCLVPPVSAVCSFVVVPVLCVRPIGVGVVLFSPSIVFGTVVVLLRVDIDALFHCHG